MQYIRSSVEENIISLALVRIPGIIGVLCQGVVSFVQIIRTRAVYEKARCVLFLTIPFGLLSSVLAINSLINTDTLSAALSDIAPAGATSPAILPDATCFMVQSLHVRERSLLQFELSQTCRQSFYVTLSVHQSIAPS